MRGSSPRTLGSESLADRILRDNPARLYEFQSSRGDIIARRGDLEFEKSRLGRKVMSLRICSALAAVAVIVAAVPASAQQYPSRTVRLVVPFAAGGTGDIVARVLADRLAVSLGQSVVVENRPGATGALGSKAVLSAAPDGHTILVGQTGEMAINQHWAKGLGYDPVADFQPIALATIVPLALVVPGKASYSVPEMLATAKSRGLAFASSGAATPGHFAGEVLKLRTKSNMNHVP